MSTPDTTPTETSKSDESTNESSSRLAGTDTRVFLLKGALVVLTLVALFALINFYTSTIAIINEWVGQEYRPLFRAGFNLIMLLVAGLGISLVVRELME